MILFIKTSQAWHKGMKYGTLAKLIDEDGLVLARLKGGGFNMEYSLLKPWVMKTYAHIIDFDRHHLSDGGSFYDLQNILGYHGVTIRKVPAPVTNLHVYEVTQ